MAAFFSKNCNFWICFFIISAMIGLGKALIKFRVGGSNGWREPGSNQKQIYIQWALKNNFHVGDIIYFEYKEDSVFVVNQRDYISCYTGHPIMVFNDGRTSFRLDCTGVFYFISGAHGHCENGQKVFIKVGTYRLIKPPPPLSPPPPPRPFFPPQDPQVPQDSIPFPSSCPIPKSSTSSSQPLSSAFTVLAILAVSCLLHS